MILIDVNFNRTWSCDIFDQTISIVLQNIDSHFDENIGIRDWLQYQLLNFIVNFEEYCFFRHPNRFLNLHRSYLIILSISHFLSFWLFYLLLLPFQLFHLLVLSLLFPTNLVQPLLFSAISCTSFSIRLIIIFWPKVIVLCLIFNWFLLPSHIGVNLWVIFFSDIIILIYWLWSACWWNYHLWVIHWNSCRSSICGLNYNWLCCSWCNICIYNRLWASWRGLGSWSLTRLSSLSLCLLLLWYFSILLLIWFGDYYWVDNDGARFQILLLRKRKEAR